MPMVSQVSDSQLALQFLLVLVHIRTAHSLQAGQYWVTLVDAYGASGIVLLFVVFFEVVGYAWGFGKHRRSPLLAAVQVA